MYKRANQYQVPVRLLIPQGPSTYLPLETVVWNGIKSGQSLLQIYKAVTLANPAITHVDVAMTYVALQGTQSLRGREIPRGGFAGFLDPSILRTINEFYTAAGRSENVLASLSTLDGAYGAWYEQFSREYNRDQAQYRTIAQTQEKLEGLMREEEQNPIYNSMVNITTVILSFSPQITEGGSSRPVQLSDGPDLFNQASPSEFVPFIKYNDGTGQSLYKVWIGESIEGEPKYKTIVIPDISSSADHTIYFRMWLGDPSTTPLPRATKESFVNIVWFLKSNILTIEVPANEHDARNNGGSSASSITGTSASSIIGGVPSVGRQNRISAIGRFQSVLPALHLGEGSEIRVRGDFIIWNFVYHDFVFLDLILNEPLFRTYLYVEESVKPYSLKKRFDVHYKSLKGDNTSVLTVSLSLKTLDQESIRPVTATSRTFIPGNPPSFHDTKILKDTPYIQAKIIKANSRKVVSEFLLIFRLLLQQYRKESPAVGSFYLSVLPELREIVNRPARVKKSKKVSARGETKLRQLQAAAPDIFIADFARQCQQSKQPIVITDSEVSAWASRQVSYKGRLVDRPVMPFPVRNPRLLLTCPGDSSPFIGVKVNTKLSNRDAYPYIPCCYGQIQTVPGSNTNYNHYINGLAPQRRARGTKTENKIKTAKILAPGGFGYVPKAVESLLSGYPDLEGDILRYGVIRSPNSFLHCVSLALGDTVYLGFRSDEERELYVQNMRTYLADHIQPTLLMQELYGFAPEEIMVRLRDHSVFFDPKIFYRAIEEVYKVSVYTFVPPAAGDELGLGSIEVPRHHLFHANTPHLDRPTICVLKSYGSESDALEYPQCELIVDWDKPGNSLRKIFDTEMNTICSKALTAALSTITWGPDRKGYKNLYSSVDHLSIFSSYQPVNQFIDQYGKMRALTFSYGPRNQRMTIMTVPSQPENLPFSTDVHPISLEAAMSLLSELVSSVTRNESGEIVGLWITLKGAPDIEFVPITPTTITSTSPFPSLLSLPLGPPNPLQTTGLNTSERIRRLRRTLNIIVQLVQWLFEIYRTVDTDPFPDRFGQRYMEAGNITGDSSEIYKLGAVPRQLPTVKSVEEALAFLHRVAPTLVRANGKLFMYNQVFGAKIVEMLRDYDHEHLGKPPKIPEVISGYYSSINDYREQPHVLIFLDSPSFQAYLRRRSRKDMYEIGTRITTAMTNSQEPFFHRTEGGKIYLIQNVLDGNLDRALTVADTWIREGRNLGFHAPITFARDPRVFPDTLIYTLTPSETLTLYEDRSNERDNFFQIINYSPGPNSDPYYAAMLLVL